MISNRIKLAFIITVALACTIFKLNKCLLNKRVEQKNLTHLLRQDVGVYERIIS